MKDDEIQAQRDAIKAKVDEYLAMGTWVVAIGNAPNTRLLGCAQSVQSGESIINLPSKEGILKYMPSCILALSPVFEYVVQVGMDPTSGGLSKKPLVLPIDMCSEETTIYISPHALLFLNDVRGEDREVFRDNIANGILIMRGSKRTEDGPTEARRILTPEELRRETAGGRRH